MSFEISHFFHSPTGTLSYLVCDRAARQAAIIDPVLGYEAASGGTSTSEAQAMLAALEASGCELQWILETHAHADHMTAARFIQARTGARIGAGAGIVEVQRTFQQVFNLSGFVPDGRDFDHLFLDGESFSIGDTPVRVMSVPGHTSDSVAYVFDGGAFVGDTLFRPDFGSGRCDFPGGDADLLYESAQKLRSYMPCPKMRGCICATIIQRMVVS
jgi:glyoxylase-like metal-dependent hydrolase (beta-lactamase superfamily II)